MIQFGAKYSLTNGHKLNKRNWQNVIAKAKEPCTNVKGVKAIDEIIARDGQYFETWVLRYEKSPFTGREGYIFREVNHNGGINGFHKTYRKAIFFALSHRIDVFLQDNPQTT